MGDDLVPSELRLTPRKTALVVVWEDGGRTAITAADLRRHCRCAGCTATRERGKPLAGDAGVTIETVAPVGGYAVNIAFSDGHARGIYPWALLRELARSAPGSA